MRYASELVPGRLLRRYKRFLVDVRLEDGSEVTAHSNNTGAMRGCLRRGARVWLRPVDAPHRKLPYTFTLIQVGRALVCVDTSLGVPMVREALRSGLLPELDHYPRVIPEVRYGVEGRSRVDLLLSRGGELPAKAKPRDLPTDDQRVYVEVKSTTLVDDRVARFPDAVTTRGQKHLMELMEVVRSGQRAAMVYAVMRSDVDGFGPADSIDPIYGRLLRRAVAAGVEVYALRMRVGPRQLGVLGRLPIEL
ncbi:MAG: DNA/RNA nuclease SfsA [Deltaproteobacteria bacterium]|nr:DNA/RNA nuclease SfsA [Deltaproteobacteria bacterium]